MFHVLVWRGIDRKAYQSLKITLFCFRVSLPTNTNTYARTLIVIAHQLKAGPPWFEFLVIFDFFCTMVSKKYRHLLWKLHKKIQSKSWSNVPPKLLACVRFLYKVVHKIGRLRKFNHAREIEFNFFTVWTIFMKLGTLVRHIHGYKRCLRFFNFCTKLWKIITKSLGKN